jgi:hypothetical protein
LREETAKKGLDPNVWIGSVELVAAAKVGMETVTYIANIYKYYVAFKLLAVKQEERDKTRQQLEEKPSFYFCSESTGELLCDGLA